MKITLGVKSEFEKLATFSLLLFVVVSVAYFVYDEIRLNSLVQKRNRSTDSGDTSLIEDYVTLYYFHGTIRCQTCLDMESMRKRFSRPISPPG